MTETSTVNAVDTQEMLQVVTRELADYVSGIPFDNVAVLLSWLHTLNEYADQDLSRDEIYDRWQPQSDTLVQEFGGTNCIGASKIFQRRLEKWGIESSVALSPSNRLPEGCEVVDVPFQHVGLVIRSAEDNFYLVDPGLGLVIPLQANTQPVEVADRIYHATFSDSEGMLSIVKPDGTRLLFNFIFPQGETDTEAAVQKPLLRATTAFKIDGFTPTGEKNVSLKLDFYHGKINYMVHGNAYGFTFDEIEQMFADESFELLVYQMEHLTRDEIVERIRLTVTHKQDVVDTWLEGLQRQYYLDNPEKLSPYMTSWEELGELGYIGGGVVVCLLNEHNEVLLYTVPEGKDKPKINRYAGQMNMFVETADQTQPEATTIATLEDFETNARRAFAEEIGLSQPETFVYREVDYMPGIRARCMIARVNSADIDHVMQHNAVRNQLLGRPEIGALKWVDPNRLDAQWLEPNAAGILKKMITEGLIPTRHQEEDAEWML